MKKLSMQAKIKTILEQNDNTLPAYAWPGGYPLFYLTADNGVLCSDCANMAVAEDLAFDSTDEQWYLIDYDINYEDKNLYCDHCSNYIESAYGDDE